MRIRQGVKDTVRLMAELIGLLSRRFGWALLLGLALAVAALLLFAGLADEVLEGDTRRFDEAVRLAVHQSASPPLTSLMWVVTSLGSVSFLILIGLCAVLGFLKAGWRRAALFFPITMAGAALLNMVLKLSFQRTRPAPFFDTPPPSSYSFPSGHALMSFCFYGALAAIVTARTRSRTGRVVIWTLAALLVTLIGFSRVYLGVHYPSDVLAGYAAATVWVAVVALGDRLVGRNAVPPSAVLGRVRRLFHLCVLALFPFTYPLAQSPRPAPRDDTQNWNEVEIAKPLNKKVDLEFYGQLRLGRDLSRFVDERVGFGFSFKPNKYLNLEPSYRYIAAQPVAGLSTREHRLSFEATVSVPFRGFTLSDRNLVDRRLRSSGNTTQYRNRLQLEHPLKLGGFEATLFAADEVFYDSRERAWIRNRFLLGLSRKFGDRYTGEIYYLRQTDGFSRPGDLHVIGTTLRVRCK